MGKVLEIRNTRYISRKASPLYQSILLYIYQWISASIPSTSINSPLSLYISMCQPLGTENAKDEWNLVLSVRIPQTEEKANLTKMFPTAQATLEAHRRTWSTLLRKKRKLSPRSWFLNDIRNCRRYKRWGLWTSQDQGRAEAKEKSTQSYFHQLNVVLLARSLPPLGRDRLEKE